MLYIIGRSNNVKRKIESEDNRGCYLIYDEKIDKGFKVWEVSYEKNLS